MSVKKVRLLLALTLSANCCLGALAQAPSQMMQQGIDEYNHGSYDMAAGHLGEALSTDFNNATLHYFLANCYLHMKQKESAIRELRITYALQPKGEVGELASKGLVALGVKPTGDASKAPGAQAAATPAVASDPVKDKALSALKQQADALKSARAAESQSMADQSSRLATDQIARQKSAIEDQYKRYSWHGYPYQGQVPQDAYKPLDGLQKIYDSQKNSVVQSGAQQAQEIDKSSANLQGLLDQKARPGGSQLVPNGTNLYIRNYQSTTSPTTPTSTAPPKTSTTPKPSK